MALARTFKPLKNHSKTSWTKFLQLYSSSNNFIFQVLSYIEKFIQTKEDLKNLENKLNDYEDIQGLVEIIKNVFQDLTEKVDERISE